MALDLDCFLELAESSLNELGLGMPIAWGMGFLIDLYGSGNRVLTDDLWHELGEIVEEFNGRAPEHVCQEEEVECPQCHEMSDITQIDDHGVCRECVENNRQTSIYDTVEEKELDDSSPA